ncbi:MAG: sugar ABC transporter permease [Firmicutes bacterium]|nr:sugar ABC transporter permease [Bacillota bacterium]
MRRGKIHYAKYGYIFSIPFVLAFLVFMAYPTVYTLIIGFTDLKGANATGFHFLSNPFENFTAILHNQTFLMALQNTGFIWICNFIPQIALALLLTAWFTNSRMKVKGQGTFKVLFYMPNIITAATIGILFYQLFGYPIGPVNSLLQSLGILKEPSQFLMSKTTSQMIVSFIQFWMWYGSTMIVLIAGVMGINPALFEAAAIDGASGTQVFFRVTLPQLRTILLYTLVTSLVGGLQMFDIPKLFNNGNPGGATTTASLFIYNLAFQGTYQKNRAAAASMILFVIIAVLSAILFFIMRDRDAAKLKKQERALRRTAKRGEAVSL